MKYVPYHGTTPETALSPSARRAWVEIRARGWREAGREVALRKEGVG